MFPGTRIKETTTTTGTGNITLAGAVANFRTFDTAIGQNIRIPITIVHQSANEWEEGLYYLSAATTLVRETVITGSSGVATAVNFSAGTKDVFCSNSEAVCEGGAPGIYGSTKTHTSEHLLNVWSAAANSVADRCYYMPHIIKRAVTITNLICQVDTAVASTKARMGIVRVGADGSPSGSPIVETADVDTTTTGQKTAAVTNTRLLPGCYFDMILVSGAVGFLATGRTNSIATWIGDISALYQTITAGWTTLPTTHTITGTLGIFDAAQPGMKWRVTT